MFGLHYLLPGDFRLGVGAGPGFNKASATPKVRVVGSLEWAPQIPPPPPPPPTATAITTASSIRKTHVRTSPASRNADPKKNGCPLRDRDGDDILDDDDACPDEPGVAERRSAEERLPDPDRDGDSIVDERRRVPGLPGIGEQRSGEERLSATPTATTSSIRRTRVRPSQDRPTRIRRRTAARSRASRTDRSASSSRCSSTLQQRRILHASDVILNAVLKIVAGARRDHEDLDRGPHRQRRPAKYNKDLSNRRAASVRKWLVQHGVDASRLSSAGYGLERPIADNVTEEGRQENRRVEFHIKEIHGKAVDENKVDEQIEDDSSSTPAKGSSGSSE